MHTQHSFRFCSLLVWCALAGWLAGWLLSQMRISSEKRTLSREALARDFAWHAIIGKRTTHSFFGDLAMWDSHKLPFIFRNRSDLFCFVLFCFVFFFLVWFFFFGVSFIFVFFVIWWWAPPGCGGNVRFLYCADLFFLGRGFLFLRK